MALRSNDSEVSRYSMMLPLEDGVGVLGVAGDPDPSALVTTAWVRAWVMKSSIPGSAVLFSRTGTWTSLMPGGRLVRSE